MSTGEGEDVFINEHLVARKDPDREAWEITDAEGTFRGRVVKRAGSFLALKPFAKEFYSVGRSSRLRQPHGRLWAPRGRVAAEAHPNRFKVRPCR
jgi:hypothetical protein